MLNTVEQESMLRYLLGELSEEEQREIEERYFNDTEYFEGLVKLEENLIDEYTQQDVITAGHEKKDRTILAKIDTLPEARFAKEWIGGMLEMKALFAREEQAAGQTVFRAKSRPEFNAASKVAEFYEAKLQKAKLALNTQEAENLLAEAWADRELISALMDSDWLGLKMLITLKSVVQVSASDLATALDVHINSVTPLLVRLVQFGAMKEAQNLFFLTERGNAVIRNLELATLNNI
jgi:hypothetical protein